MRKRTAIACVVGLAAIAGLALAQSRATMSARLDWVPVSLRELTDVSGEGAATATLSGTRLSIIGEFGGLPAAATLARLHQGPATGASGPAIADLEVTHDTDGTLRGDVDLETDQLAALLAGHLYIQLYAERGVAPDNAVLRGWLLAPARPTSREQRRAR